MLSRLEDLERALLRSRDRNFIDDTLQACVFAAFYHLDLSQKINENLLDDYPRLRQFMVDTKNIESVATKLSEKVRVNRY